MAMPLVDKGWLSLREASEKYGQARTSFYLWERKGLLKLRRFPIGRPNVFVDEKELEALLRGRRPKEAERDRRDRTALNTESLKKIWDNDVDVIYDAIDWRTGKRAKT